MKQTSSRKPGASGAARLRSVLVAIDLTPSSDRVLGRLALLPLASDARVTILHVVPGGLPPSERRNAELDAHKALASEARHLRKSLPKHASIQPLLKHGVAAKEIVACAARVKAELVVMGRGGGRALRDTFLGSTAERVVRLARLPVLVVRLAPRVGYRRPALALDLEQPAHDVVRLMLRVLPPPRPPVAVIHAYGILYERQIYPSLSHDEIEKVKHRLRQKAAHALATSLADAAAEAGVPAEQVPRWQTYLRYGAPRSVVEKATETIEPDLLVLGTHGYSGAAYVFLGTVAGDLLRAAKCDVLVVPPSTKVTSPAAG